MVCQEETNSIWGFHNSQIDMRSNMTIVEPPLLKAHSGSGIGLCSMYEGSNLRLTKPTPAKQP